jgi:type II secretory pathway component PulC
MHHVALIPALAYLFYVVISTVQASGSPENFAIRTAESSQLDHTNTKIKPIDILVIKDWHLFGQSALMPAQNDQQHETPQETQLQLKLLGIFLKPDQNKSSYAIIEADDHLQKKYRSSDELPGGATLQSIAKEQVILLRNSQRESLSMDRKKSGLLLKTE